MTAPTQPVPGPPDVASYEQLLASGQLVNLGGSPLVVQTCASCGDTTVGETCPQSLTCATCGARPGAPCQRPSQHQISGWHKPRITAAADTDDAREQAGDPSVPRRWAS